jgi:Fic family protein
VRRYLWQVPGWPSLQVDLASVPELHDAVRSQGEVAGVLRALGRNDRARAELDALAETALDTSAIENERISRDSVRASLLRRLREGGPPRPEAEDPRADGVVAVTLDAIQNAREPVTRARLYRWQTLLFPDPPASLALGKWRRVLDDPMHVVSGPAGRPTIHFEAPPAAQVDAEMRALLEWIEAPDASPALVKAAIAHLRFLTIHPFADGNGRVARALADLLIARGSPETAAYVALSRQILKDRERYYDALQSAQRGELDVTAWVRWFVGCYRRASNETLRAIGGYLRAAAFWHDHREAELNARQRKVLERYLAGGFDGWINSRNYSAIAKTSTDTAQRDLADLVAKGLIVSNDGRARKTSYRLSDEYDPHPGRHLPAPEEAS